MKMHSIVSRTTCLAAMLFAGLCTGYSQNTKVVGRISDDAVDLALGGALVQVVGTDVKSYTDPQGNYVLSGIPAGTQSLRISYLGYDSIEGEVRVPEEGLMRADASFSTD